MSSISRAIKFQNFIPELNINILDEYQQIFNLYNSGIFINGLTDCKTRKYKLNERKNKQYARPLSDRSFNQINNQCPFDLYIIDTYYKAFAVLKIEKVYQKNIPKEENNLIPNVLKDFCSHSYYKFSNIEILPYESSNAIINITSKNTLFDVKQINPNSPWYVEKIEGIFADYLITNTPKLKEYNLGFHPNYCVYRYYINLPMGQLNYIGLTNDLSERYNHHSNKASWNSKNEKNKLLYMAFKNVGYDKFMFEVLHDNLTEQEAHYWEAKEIQNYNAYYPTGFNVRNEDKYLKNNLQL